MDCICNNNALWLIYCISKFAEEQTKWLVYERMMCFPGGVCSLVVFLRENMKTVRVLEQCYCNAYT